MTDCSAKILKKKEIGLKSKNISQFGFSLYELTLREVVKNTIEGDYHV